MWTAHGCNAKASTDIIGLIKTKAQFCSALLNTATSRLFQYGDCGFTCELFQSSQTTIAVKSLIGANTADRVPTTIFTAPRSTANQFLYRVAGPSSAAKIAKSVAAKPCSINAAATRSIAVRSGTTAATVFPLLATLSA